MEHREILEQLTRDTYAGYWAGLGEEVLDVTINGDPTSVLVFTESEFVGWLRLQDDSAILRYGSMTTTWVSSPIPADNVFEENNPALVNLLNEAMRKMEITWPPEPIGEAEYIQFIEQVEAGVTPSPWSEERSLPESADVVDRSEETLPGNKGYTHGADTPEKVVRLETSYPAAVPAVVASIALFLAVMEMPFGYYSFLRITVTAAAIWMAIVATRQKRGAWTVVFSAIAILFNPIVQITATKAFWTIPDIVCMVLFATAGTRLYIRKPEAERIYAKSM